MADFDLSGRIAFVTGASGGLGSHFARLLARHGAAVVLAARREEELHRLADEITQAKGRAHPVTMDVGDPASVQAALDQAEAAFGVPDILVNGAGIAGRGARMLDLPEGEFARVVEVNLNGAFRVAREAARRMAAAGRGGSIVNVASILAFGTAVGVAAYAASKAALVHLTREMALEWARHGIRVNALAPGYIPTDLNRAFLESPSGERLRARIPLGRFGTPEDLDGPLLLLASDAGRYITGTVLVVDGGHLCAPI
ncbi:2-dehydro-3-deoxy-D-gluconate 5-dehydrogenase [bacterium HR39]|nr:2-dehydro-3-deoxy-D-gluconate 5-dehydrogenase [bacterium HR39]